MKTLSYSPEIDSLICEQYLLEQGRQTPSKEARLLQVIRQLDLLTNGETIFHDMAEDMLDG